MTKIDKVEHFFGILLLLICLGFFCYLFTCYISDSKHTIKSDPAIEKMLKNSQEELDELGLMMQRIK